MDLNLWPEEYIGQCAFGDRHLIQGPTTMISVELLEEIPGGLVDQLRPPGFSQSQGVIPSSVKNDGRSLYL